MYVCMYMYNIYTYIYTTKSIASVRSSDRSFVCSSVLNNLIGQCRL